jgi:hypothetical protein
MANTSDSWPAPNGLSDATPNAFSNCATVSGRFMRHLNGWAAPSASWFAARRNHLVRQFASPRAPRKLTTCVGTMAEALPHFSPGMFSMATRSVAYATGWSPLLTADTSNVDQAQVLRSCDGLIRRLFDGRAREPVVLRLQLKK